MKKAISIISATVIICVCVSACGLNDIQSTDTGKNSGNLKIVTTIFPEYDWINEILGDNGADVTLLLDNGVDLHSYQPTAEDILDISTCDLFIYVGGESDEWVEDALKETINSDMAVLNLLDVLGANAKEEEVVEGMQEEENDEGEEAEYDEHVWLSLRNAQIICDAIADTLSEIDSENSETYKNNVNEYKEKLSALDNEYTAVTDAAAVKTLLFGDRFPFRYMTDDYGLDYYAAFSGCSAETEASFETISFLSEKVDELGLSNIMTIEGTDHRIAETIAANTKSKNQQILTLDSMQSTTAADISDGAAYLSIMQKNLDILKRALK